MTNTIRVLTVYMVANLDPKPKTIAIVSVNFSGVVRRKNNNSKILH